MPPPLLFGTDRLLDTAAAVADRYTAAAQQREAALCCPVDYDAKYLKVIPAEVIERDYGCGDPSKYVRTGETVLDLGSGGGKICFIAAQVVGRNGRVLGVDINDEMLELARRSAPAVAEAIGYDNVTFHRGQIQDLAIDRDAVAEYLSDHPVTDELSLRKLESFIATQRRDRPMIADESIDVVVSNCVLNLVDPALKPQLFAEIARVLKPGGRAVISDIIADDEVPQSLQDDAELWSGCISGAMPRQEFLDAFEVAGLTDTKILELQTRPWQVIDDLAFRSMTLVAHKPLRPIEREPEAGWVYRGPFYQVCTDDGLMITRGEVLDEQAAAAVDRDSLREHFVQFGGEGSKAKPMGLPVSCGTEGCC